MEYTIKKLAQLAGISTRTLRYYDERFTAYYDDKIGKGASKLLRDIIIKYAK